MDSTEKILDIKVNYADAIKAIAEYKTKIDALKDSEKEYKKQLKEGTIGRQEYNELMTASKVQITSLNDSIRVLTKQMQNQIKQEKANEGSLNQLRATISLATAEYDAMSEAERNSAKGQELKNHINEITDALKGGEEETQRYYRNVGNYEGSLAPLFDKLNKKLDEQTRAYEELLKTQGESSQATQEAKKAMEETEQELNNFQSAADGVNESVTGFVGSMIGFDSVALNMITQIKSLGEGAKIAAGYIKALTVQFLTLLANPVVAFLSLLATAIMAVAKGISSSEENTNRLNAVLAPLNRILDSGVKVLQQFAGAILSVLEGGGKLLGWIGEMLEMLPLLGEKFKEQNELNRQYIEMAKERATIDRETRDLEVQNAKNALTIATLKAKADDELNVSAEERMKAIKEANRLEEQSSRQNYELAKRRYELLVQQNALAENTKETNDAIAQAEIEMYNALTEYQDKRGELLGREVSLANEIKQAEKEKADAAKAAAEEAIARKQKELQEIRKAEDEILKLVTDSREQQRQSVTNNYNRQIEDLKNRLKTETGLTVKARQAINTQITALEKQKNAELATLSDEYLKEDIDKRVTYINNLLQAVKDGSTQEYQLRLNLLEEQQKQELMDKELTEQEKLAINQKYQALADELTDEYEKKRREKEIEAVRLRMENGLLELQNKGASELQILQETEEQKREWLEQIREEDFETEEEYNNARLQAQAEYNDAKKALVDKEIAIEQERYDAAAKITGGLASLFDALGESNKEFAMLSKVLALAEIAINTGKAIAAGIAQAQSVPFPANIGAIATTIAAILSGVTSAVSTVNSAKFASGGLVTGPGTGTSDSISARLSNGESVMTAETTSMFAPLLSALNVAGGGVPITVAETSSQTIGEDMLAQAFVKGMSNMPSPVVSVEEINRVGNRVKVIENIGSV